MACAALGEGVLGELAHDSSCGSNRLVQTAPSGRVRVNDDGPSHPGERGSVFAIQRKKLKVRF